MTSPTLKTVLVDAMERSTKHWWNDWDGRSVPMTDMDAVAQAIRDHVFDREKVRAALVNIGFKYDEGFAGSDDLPPRPAEFEFTPHRCSIADDLIDRLIEGLIGKVGE